MSDAPTYEQLQQLVERLTAQVVELERIVREQADEIAELQRRSSADSSNSSRPPSSDAPWSKQPARIPVIAILDTNCDPDEVAYPIPGNDDAIRFAALLTRVIADAVADGLTSPAGCGAAAGEGEDKPEPKATTPPLPILRISSTR